MSVTKCLKCDEAVLIPAGASLKATVRCPLCQEQFELAELLDEMPPPLEIVEDPEAVAAAGVKPFNFDFEGQKEHSNDTDSYRMTGEESDSNAAAVAPAFQFEDSSGEDTGDEGSAAKPRRPTGRPKRKEKNPAVEIAKVFGGGVLGIALAIVGIWWVAKKDPFKIGPKVSVVAPWIVPEQFHGAAGDDDGADDQESDKNSEKEKRANDNNPDRRAIASREQNEHIGNRSFSKSPFNTDDDTGAKIDDGGSDVPRRTSDPPKVDRNSPDFAGIRNTESTSPEDFEKVVNAADVALTKWAPEEDFDSDSFRQDAFDAIEALGKSIATVNQQDPANERSIARTQTILEDFKGKDEKLAIINARAAEQLKSEEPDVQGILLAGKVKSITAQGTLFETRLELLTEDQEEIAVMTLLDPTAFSPPGATVIVIGALINDPIANFASYGGEDSQVVCCGRLDLLQPPPVKKVKP